MKFRLFLVGLLVLFDALILPKLVFMFVMLIKGVPVAVSSKAGWVFFWNIIGKDYATGYYIMQIAIVGFSFLLLWKTDSGIKYKMSNGIGGPQAAGKGEFGTARWQTEKEFDKENHVWKMSERPNEGGLVIGANIQKDKSWVVTEDEHGFIIGATSSGKSRKLILPSIWNICLAGESMVITDPKGELYENTKSFLEKEGYNVVMIDFREPKQSTHHWNPMQQVVQAIKEGNESKASEHAWNIAHMIVHQKKHSGDPIWANGQESVIAALILYVAMESKNDSEKHMASVYQMIVEYSQTKVRMSFGGVEEYVPLIELMNDLPPGHIAKNAFATAAIAPERTRGSFFSGVAADLRLFADPSVAYLTSFQDHSLEASANQKTATFLIIPDEVKTRHFLAALYVDQKYLQLVDNAAKTDAGRIKVKTRFLLDEFGNMPKITDFDTKITVSRGRGILFYLVVQGLDQVKEKYDKLADTITGNCRVWVYLLTNDIETAKIISAKLGKYTITSQGFSTSSKTYDTSSSHSQNLTGRDLLTPDEIMRFPGTHAIVLRARQLPGQILTPDISQYPIKFEKIKRGDYQTENMKYKIFNPYQEHQEYEILTEEREIKEELKEEPIIQAEDLVTNATEIQEQNLDELQNELENLEIPSNVEIEEKKTSYMDLI